MWVTEAGLKGFISFFPSLLMGPFSPHPLTFDAFGLLTI